MALKTKISIAAAIVLTSLALSTAPTTRADSLLPGGTDSSPTFANINGAILADTGAQAFSFVGDTGTVSELAVRDTITGNMDFIYQVKVVTGLIGALTGFNFAGFTTNVGWSNQVGGSITSTGTVAPSSIASSADGSVITFNFSPNVNSSGGGATTFDFWVQTNASGFTSGSIGLIDGGGQTLNGFAPTGAPVSAPEPSSMFLLGAGLLLTPLLRLKRPC